MMPTKVTPAKVQNLNTPQDELIAFLLPNRSFVNIVRTYIVAIETAAIEKERVRLCGAVEDMRLGRDVVYGDPELEAADAALRDVLALLNNQS